MAIVRDKNPAKQRRRMAKCESPLCARELLESEVKIMRWLTRCSQLRVLRIVSQGQFQLEEAERVKSKRSCLAPSELHLRFSEYLVIRTKYG